MALLKMLSVAVGVCSVSFLLSVAWKVEHTPGGVESALKEARTRLREASVALSPAEGDSFFEAYGEEGWLPEANVHVKNLPHKDCFASVSDLPEEALRPRAGARHMVDPPHSSEISLVCCATTQGALNIAVHPRWAPRGATHFLAMVADAYFEAGVPLFRCLAGFICQFGISADPERSKRWRKSIPDDPSWLPLGPKHRTNADGVKRFPRGYLAYAGAGACREGGSFQRPFKPCSHLEPPGGGPNTRGNQFIVSIADSEALCGGSPWEVPWGEIVGDASFNTLSKFYTGYGEKGPSQGRLSQGRLSNKGVDEELRAEFPLMDYITSCQLVDNTTTSTQQQRLRR